MHFIIKKVLDSSDWTLIITADHGNLERIYNPKTGSPDTEHTGFPVPFYLVSRPFFRKKTESDIAREKSSPPKGTLEDVAPTILHLLGLCFFSLVFKIIQHFGYEAAYHTVESWFDQWGFWIMFFAGFAFNSSNSASSKTFSNRSSMCNPFFAEISWH